MKLEKISAVMAAFALIFVFSTAVFAQTLETKKVEPAQFDYSRLAVALEQSGLQYQKLALNHWSMTIMNGDKPVKVSIATNKDIISLMIGIIPAPKEASAELNKALLDLNNKYYFVKFVDDGTNIYSRVDILLVSVNGASLANLGTRLVMATSDEAEGITKLVPAAE